jgi:hypothetical protein
MQVKFEYDLNNTSGISVAKQTRCIVIGRYALYINTPKKIYNGKQMTLDQGKFLKQILCK